MLLAGIVIPLTAYGYRKLCRNDSTIRIINDFKRLQAFQMQIELTDSFGPIKFYSIRPILNVGEDVILQVPATETGLLRINWIENGKERSESIQFALDHNKTKTYDFLPDGTISDWDTWLWCQ